MKVDWSHLEKFRVLKGPYASEPGDHYGLFLFIKARTTLQVIASEAFEEIRWEHVSVVAKYKKQNGKVRERMPSWDEMSMIKDAFWEDTEAAMQLHVPAAMHINCHPFCLHIWKPADQEIPLPPPILVGPTDETT